MARVTKAPRWAWCPTCREWVGAIWIEVYTYHGRDLVRLPYQGSIRNPARTDVLGWKEQAE